MSDLLKPTRLMVEKDIPGYEKMTFEQKRQAQDQNAARRNQ
jgi:hypothetical protein